jgi:hypothetical protein
MPRYAVVTYTLPDIYSRDQREAAADAMMGDLPLAAIELELYSAKRIVEATDLEHLYFRCQHLEPMDNHPMEGLRSMSIGDFAVEEDGTVHLCKSIGWEEAPADLADRIRPMAEALFAGGS